MANSANGKRTSRPTGAAKSTASARPVGNTARSATNGATSTNGARNGAKETSAKGTSGTSAGLAGIRERTGRPAASPRKSLQARRIQQRPWYLGGGVIWAAVAGVLVVVIVFLLIAHAGNADQYYKPVPATVFHQITHVDPTTLAKVGAGGLPQPLTAAPANTPILKDASGKPIVLYMGAEYCPYCAGERWALIIALSRFGTFSNLHTMVSSDTEGDISSLPTYTFRGSTYTSPYITFQTVEMEDRYQATLETPSAAQDKIFNQYDYPPYVASNSGGGIPFVSYANQYFGHSAGYSVAVLAGSTREEIASNLNDPTNNVTQSILGTANYITSAICALTNNQPASVCTTDPSLTVKNPIPALIKTLPAHT